MNYELSQHAAVELERRAIPASAVEAVLAAPEQRVPEHGNVMCYQSRVRINRKLFLLRVMVDDTRRPPVVVTVYRTSKISKYWSQT